MILVLFEMFDAVRALLSDRTGAVCVFIASSHGRFLLADGF